MDTVLLDLDGLEHLFGPPEEIARAIARHMSRLGARVNVAVASDPDAAVHLARGMGRMTPQSALPDTGQSAIRNPQSAIGQSAIVVVPPGQEAEAVARLPLEVLGAPPEIQETFDIWGLKTFRDLAALPAHGLSERLGAEGLRLQALARGAGGRALVVCEAPPVYEASLELEHPVALMEPLSFILGRLLGEVCRKLEERALATNELCLRLKLEDSAGAQPRRDQRPQELDSSGQESNPQSAIRNPQFERLLRLPFPIRDTKTCLKLLQLHLEQHPPRAAVLAVALRAEAVRPRTIQHGLFLPPVPEPEKLELTLARIANLVGEGNAGSPELLDTHRPDAFRMVRPDFTDGHAGRRRRVRRGQALAEQNQCRDREGAVFLNPQSAIRDPQSNPPRLAFRVFRPPLKAEVDAPGGRPERIHAWERPRPAGLARGISGRVTALAGPWRTSGDWWTADGWSRDEWDVLVSRPTARVPPATAAVSGSGSARKPRSGGALYRVYLDRQTGCWFIEGSYD